MGTRKFEPYRFNYEPLWRSNVNVFWASVFVCLRFLSSSRTTKSTTSSRRGYVNCYYSSNYPRLKTHDVYIRVFECLRRYNGIKCQLLYRDHSLS